MANFLALLGSFVRENGDGELETREVVQIALRVADKALELYADKKITPEEIWVLFNTAYEEYKKESND